MNCDDPAGVMASDGANLTDEQIDAIAAREHHAGRLPWLGFVQDADGRYSIPLVTESERALIRACIAGVKTPVEGRDG